MTNAQGFNIRDFTPNYWGKLKQFQVPTHLFKNNVLDSAYRTCNC